MKYCLLIFGLFVYAGSFCQEKVLQVSEKQSRYFSAIEQKFAKLDNAIISKTSKSLKRLQREEKKLYRKLYKKDSLAAKQLFAGSTEKYAQLEAQLKQAADPANQKKLKEYLPFYDTLITGLSFLQKNTTPDIGSSLTNTQQVVQRFGNSLQSANEIKRVLKERKQLLQEQLGKFGLTKQMKRLNKEVYYYQQQLNEYKALLKDPKKMEQKAIALLRNNDAFKAFMKKHSILSQLFKVPDDYGSAASLAGLQTRASVQQLLQTRFAGAGVNPQQYIQQQVSQAQTELNKLKQKIKDLTPTSRSGGTGSLQGGSSSDIDMPEQFKPNTQKTKSFLQRFEYGANFQTQKVNSLFPVTTDIALNVGYKLNDKSVIGIGASYKIGWGSGIEHIKITHEGVGIRSYIDWKAPFGSSKGGMFANLWITGGYEQNYLQRFNDLRQISDINVWRQSALLGLSKKIKIGKKKTSKVQLLYDFFYKNDNIRTQPLVFRVGYEF